MSQAIPELVEIAGCLAVIIHLWRKHAPLTKGAAVLVIVSLSIDVLYFHCVRPSYVQEAYNFCIAVIGGIVIYEEHRELLKRLGAFFLSLFM